MDALYIYDIESYTGEKTPFAKKVMEELRRVGFANITESNFEIDSRVFFETENRIGVAILDISDVGAGGGAGLKGVADGLKQIHPRVPLLCISTDQNTFILSKQEQAKEAGLRNFMRESQGADAIAQRAWVFANKAFPHGFKTAPGLDDGPA